MERVEIEFVQQWQCPVCQIANRVVLDDEQVTEERFREFFEYEQWEELPAGWEDASLGCLPRQVTCPKCHQVFQTNVASEDEIAEFGFRRRDDLSS